MSRRADRRHVFCLIFQLEFFDEIDTKALFESYTEHHVGEAVDSKFIFDEFSGVYENLGTIDETIGENLKAWTTDRLNKADLALLRLAVYEMFYNEQIPSSVAINEAVELSKAYCEDESPGFINAILGAVSKSKARVDKNPC